MISFSTGHKKTAFEGVARITYALLTKHDSRWLDIGQVFFFAFLWAEMKSRSIKKLKSLTIYIN